MSAGEVERLIAEGEALVQQNFYEEALTSFEQALILAPQDAVAWHGKGLALAKLNRPDEARIAFEQSITLDNTYARAWRNLAITFRRLKQPENALAAGEEVDIHAEREKIRPGVSRQV
jgi:superkiller protein 3